MITNQNVDFLKVFKYNHLETFGYKFDFQFKSNGCDCLVLMKKKSKQNQTDFEQKIRKYLESGKIKYIVSTATGKKMSLQQQFVI